MPEQYELELKVQPKKERKIVYIHEEQHTLLKQYAEVYGVALVTLLNSFIDYHHKHNSADIENM